MSVGRFSRRGWAYQGWAWAGWARAGSDVVVTAPSQAGWISRTADRLSISSGQNRVLICSTQDRVWITRIKNE